MVVETWDRDYYNYYEQLTTATIRMRPKQLRTLLLHLNLFKASLVTPSREIPISFYSFFMIFFRPRRGRPAFPLAIDGWPERTIFGNLSSFNRRTCPSHLNLSFIIALKRRIKPHFSYSILYEIRSVRRVPEKSEGNFSGKHIANLHPFFKAPMFQSYI